MKHKPDDDDDVDCYHSRSLASHSDLGGRYSSLEKPFNPGAGDGYPKLPSTPLTDPADHEFNPDRDVVEDPTSDRFGVDLTKLPGTQLEASPANSVPKPVEPIERDRASSFRRRV